MYRFRHSPFATRGPTLLHHFEVWSVLESHAAYRLALAADRDLHLLRELTADCGQFHRACNAQSGNSVLAAMAERAQRDAFLRQTDTYPATEELERHHRQIVDLVERRDAEAARDAVRAHIHFLRDLSLPTTIGARW